MSTAAGRVAVITGAGSGIGRAAALSLAKRDYRLVLAGRRAAALEETAALLGTDASVLTCPTDVTDAASVARLFESAVERFGRVDLLFNNAGVSAPVAAIKDVAEADWRSVIDINVTGAFLVLQAAFRTMLRQTPRGGRIINNGSIAATAPRPHTVAYTCSKHAILGLTKATSLEGREYDIACGQIDIGNAASRMASSAAAGMLQANGTIAPEPLMSLDHAGEAVAYMDSLPPEANVQFLTVMATKMPYVGRG